MRLNVNDLLIQDDLGAASAQQRGFWFASEVDPNTPAFNLLRVLQLDGPIDKSILRRAFEAIVARHEVLRTGLIERDGTILQRVHADTQIVLEEHDLTSVPLSERRPRAHAIAGRMAQTAFDLAVPPHFRVALLRIAEEEHLLAIVFHHAIIDGSSMGLFFDELAHLYEAGRRGRPAFLPNLPIQYREFAERQQRSYAQTRFEKGIAFWRKALAGAPPVLTLPTVRPRSAAQHHRGSRLGFVVDAPLADAFRALCARRGATLFMGLLSVFQILLQRWADTDDLVVGTPV